MKLRKKLEAEIRKLYKAYWDSYINGDLETYASFLDEDFKFIGSTEAEPLLNKKDSIKLLDAVKGQMAGKAEFRNRKIKIESVDELIVINELCDGYILIGTEWNFYSRFRLSSLLKKKRNKWKFIHQHVSMPDSKAQEGEAYGLELIRTENIQLRDAVKRRTIELENKNRELEIETALERVRAVAMAMRKPEDLSGIGETLFTELKSLGFTNLRNTEIIIISDAKETLTSYYYSDYGVTGVVEVDYKSNPKVQNWVDQLKKANDAFAEVVVTEKEIKAWRKYREEVGHLPDPKLNKAKSVYYYSYSIGMGGLSISTFKPASGEQIRILERFRNVFNLSYQRYIDIANAEAQAREAQIEAALERVRSRTMAMHQTSELQEVIHTVHQELVTLNLSIDGGSFVVINDDVGPELRCWGSGGTANTSEEVQVPHFNMLFCTNLIKGIKRGPGFFTEEFSQKEKKEYFTKLFNHKPWSDLSSERKKTTLSTLGGYTRSVAVSKHTTVFVINHHGRKFTEAENDILKRFAKVFEQTYTRFLDLQKAEAQTREAQIEVAVERVRARSLAMHKSEHLHDVVRTLRNELLGLNLDGVTAATIYLKQDDGTVRLWDLSGLEKTEGFSLDIVFNLKDLDPKLWIRKIWDSKKKYIVPEQGPEDFKRMLKWLAGHNKKVAREIKEIIKLNKIKHGWHPTVKLANGKLSTDFIKEPPAETEAILSKMAAAFDLAYKRFIDLQKAEAQARESQIQLALERVRARTMAMQKSDELAEAASLLFTQIADLGTNSWSSGFIIFQPDELSINSWMSKPDGSMGVPFNIPVTEDPFFIKIYEAYKRGEEFFVMESSGKELEETYKYMFSLPGAAKALGAIEDIGFQMPTFQITHCVFFPNGFLMFITYEPCQEMWEIFKRFGKVFEQTYTRFLDLQKSEALARESQIELGLERVRARAMAMQKSDELSELVDTVFKELTKLDFSLAWCIINVIDEPSLSNTVWAANPDINAAPESYHMLFEDYPFHHAMMKGWKERQTKCIYVLEGSEKLIYDDYLFNKTEFKRVPAAAQAASRAMEKYVVTFSFSNFGGLQTVGDAPLSDASLDILSRFGKVFDLTYTRFNDLKQAEAQARESQIQLALERVRARTMAMQKSDELMETAVVLFNQLKQLGEQIERTIIGVVNEEEHVIDFWATRPDGSQMEKMQKFPIDEPIVMQKVYDAWREQKKSIVIDLQGEELENYFQVLKARAPRLKRESFGERRVESFVFFSKGMLGVISVDQKTPPHVELYERFAAVFDQTYTRFLDLQKAEAQAREAQIEAALERVRSRTMGMQKSEELKDVIQVVYDQFVHLNIHVEHTGFIMDYKTRDDMHIWLADKHAVPFQVAIPYFDCAHWNSFMEAKEKGKNFFANHLSYEEKNKFYQDLFKLIPGVPEEAVEYYFSCPGLAISTVLLENVGLYIENFSGIPYNHEENTTLMRFGKVFQQTYTRFLDLQKAEEQAREAQIEAALERVRSRTMAMQRSDELQDAALLLFKQVQALGVPSFACGFNIWDDDRKAATSWMAGEDRLQPPFKTSSSEDVFLHIHEAAQRDEQLFVAEQGGEELENHYRYMATIPEFKAVMNKMAEAGLSVPTFQIIHCAFFSQGYFMFISFEQVPDAHDIFKRFAKVFEQTYTRFLDLQNAEAQAREAEIQLALERVRARTMAMQKSEELKDVANEMRNQIGLLGQKELETCAIHLYDVSPDYFESWAALRSPNSEGEIVHIQAQFPKKGVKIIEEAVRCYESGKKDYVLLNDGAKAIEFFEMIKQYAPDAYIVVSESVKGKNVDEVFAYWSVSDFSGGSLIATTMVAPDEYSRILLQKFANVFGVAYRRFADLKKAESQAREAQIEAALEKVRSRSLAMHTTNELGEVVKVIVEKLQDLGVVLDANGVVLCTYFPNSKNVLHWIVSPDYSMTGSYLLPYFDHPIFNAAWRSKESGDEYFSKAFSVEEKNSFFEYAFEHSDYRHFPEDFKQWIFQNDKHILSFAWQKNSAILIPSHTGVVPNDAEKAILVRFARVFEQAYVRFMDLQKSEAQAREARIEAVLERVRSRTMAMQKSDELTDVASLLFEQVSALGIKTWTAGFNVWSEDNNSYVDYITSPNGGFIEPYTVLTETAEALTDISNARKSGVEFDVQYVEGEKIKQLYLALTRLDEKQYEIMLQDGVRFPSHQYEHFVFGSKVSLMFITYEPVPEAHDIFKRLGKVFEQTYTRFLDLQKAEAQTREAIKQASVDRVRAEIASMRTTNDLERIQPIIWNELTTLGIPFIRCGVFIMDEEHERVDTFLSTPEGKSIASFTSKYSDLAVINEALPYWRRKEIYKAHWDEATFLAQAKTLLAQGNITSTETYLTEHQPKDLYLHFLPFLQGILYVGNESPLNDEELQSVQNLADAFSIAYARYEDFNKLELAKGQIEKTLVDLKQTQAQLVQSEKMASLGELTAGIAHEIQNPLNFVNNFSDVNKELLVEMKEEIDKGNIEEVKAIANDIIGNEEKINHHGKRADAIVKGMLQHSRSSSGVKEPADINVLADEYLRLAYHGLRAKDKFFNATMKTEYDESIGKINIVAQDIGRSVLNLINNAFYAVAEKKKQNGEGYEPIVTITTKKLNGRIEIRVADNGNGIPHKVLDKIFQPFFTTKPPGQGTGLGLSLSYDIVTKAHGGEFSVETKDGEGTIFTVSLPANK